MVELLVIIIRDNQYFMTLKSIGLAVERKLMTGMNS